MKPKALSDHDEGLLEYLEDIIGTSQFKKTIEEESEKLEKINEERQEKANRLKFVEKEKNSLEVTEPAASYSPAGQKTGGRSVHQGRKRHGAEETHCPPNQATLLHPHRREVETETSTPQLYSLLKSRTGRSKEKSQRGGGQSC